MIKKIAWGVWTYIKFMTVMNLIVWAIFSWFVFQNFQRRLNNDDDKISELNWRVWQLEQEKK
jgi:hypothetical protein